MATRDELYAKFGITAEAAQLFETELGTLILCAQGIENNWHIKPDGEAARKALDDISRSTLGRLLGSLKIHVNLENDLADQFSSALQARNRLFHGFFEKHDFKIQSDEGRDVMVDDLELLHNEIFNAWRTASAMATLAVGAFVDERQRSVKPD